MKRQKPIQSAFETQGESAVSEAVANFFFGCDIPFAVADSVFFRRMVDALKVASVAYKPPHRMALSDKYVDIVETRVNAAKVPHYDAMRIVGATAAMDGATVHGEPIANFVLKVATIPKPIHLKIVNAKNSIAEGEGKDADFMAENFVSSVRALPDGGANVTLLLNDTAGDEMLAQEEVQAVLPQISRAPCGAHVVSLILKLIAAIPRIAEWLNEGNEVTEWFRGKHATTALLDKHVSVHCGGKKIKRPFFSPDSRMAVQFLSMLRHLELRAVYQSVVCDVVYVDLKLEDDVIKPRVLDDEWWKKSFAISKLVWPLVRLLKVTDSMLPTMSKIVGRMRQVEQFVENYLEDDANDQEYKDLAKLIYHETIDSKGHWSKLRSEFAMAAFCLDPEFYDLHPWEDADAREALMNVCTRLLHPLEGKELDEKMRKVEAGFCVYWTKAELFSKPHIWPRVENGVVNKADMMPTYEFFLSFGASMRDGQPLAVKITAQLSAATIAERDFKLYKGIATKKRSALGREKNDGTITAIRLANIHANLHLEDFADGKSPNEQESFLRSFDLDEEAKWAKTFLGGFTAAPIG